MSAVASNALLIPRNIAVGLLVIYRFLISPLYGDVCRYYPSCSRYSLEAMQSHGFLRGVWLTARRLIRCHPWSAGGIDDVPERASSDLRVTKHGFVVAHPHRKAQ
ncbi:membrane protein insertion efficiency factor YidD [Klugiella xanthotipulae]|uniref:Putative membrane protein insertion efficiency factor n=1 Tax=Klugiella xanthotipulae TaxID=244735 RepID=A0A543I6T4_9MICO|nr:membrane protein insertion efficiency factor YidD [Klugiella xanthotipulae]TQM66313.1 hypothetical protein FB466_1150 [Klugiella xanthotipulae]